MIYEIFPEAAIALAQEIKNHPRLVAMLSELPADAILEERLACIGTYCNVMLDGFYLEEDLQRLFDLLYHRLQKQGMIVLQ